MSRHRFEIYDGDAVVTIERDVTRDIEVAERIIAWMQENNAVSGESIFQSDRCQETACDLLGDIADDILKPSVEWKDD